MKLISFAVPCYNSQDYMQKCVDSLLTGGDDVEIIIVNDGSKDKTLEIANDYKQKYPDIVKVIDKPNGGHGSGVNAGMNAAAALYYKVVDSDDWLDTDALKTLLDTIKAHLAAGTLPDSYITNFVYDKIHTGERHVSAYNKKFPAGKIMGWKKVKAFRYSHLLLMHSLLYKREKLLESGTVLPEHTFYVDNLFAFQPLPFMQTVCYLNLDLYHYYIGRADQSVERKNLVKRYDQQIRVMKRIAGAYRMCDIRNMPKGLKRYMWHALQAILMNTLFFTCAEFSPERKEALKDFWQFIKDHDKKMYRKMRSWSYATVVNYLPWKLRGAILSWGYGVLCTRVELG